MLKDFKDFVARGNVMDLAVAVILGGAFGKIVTSFVDDVLMPPIGLALGGVDFRNLFLNLSGKSYATLAEAKAAGAATLNYGIFLNTVIDFLIVAFVIFLIVRQLARFKKHGAGRGAHHAPVPLLRHGHLPEGQPLSVLHVGGESRGLTGPISRSRSARRRRPACPAAGPLSLRRRDWRGSRGGVSRLPP